MLLTSGFVWAFILTTKSGQGLVPFDLSSGLATLFIVIGLVGFAGGVGYLVDNPLSGGKRK